MNSTLSKEIIDSISDGSHGDPFSVLGLHEVEIDGKSKLVLRAFRPEAKSITAVINKKKYELEPVSTDGLFERVFSRRKNRFDYDFEIVPHKGKKFTITDAYRFKSLISDFDLQLWGEGNHHQAYEFMGAHQREIEGVKGTHFVVTAPSATRVSVIGEFNSWDGRVHRMRKFHAQGIWEIFIPHVTDGDHYKYEIKTPAQDPPLKKADPFAVYSELRPGTASIVMDIEDYKQPINWCLTSKILASLMLNSCRSRNIPMTPPGAIRSPVILPPQVVSEPRKISCISWINVTRQILE